MKAKQISNREDHSHPFNDITPVFKPWGMTSFDVIRVLRKKTGVKKMGHAGTLDPLAEGLMIIGIGKGTKELSHYTGLDKTYYVEIQLGIRTDTGDAEGKIIEEKDVEFVPPREKVVETLDGLVGEIVLPVPRHSAVKQGGAPLYKRARRGEDFDPPKRGMRIEKLEYCDMEKNERGACLSVRMRVGSGVYVRSVAEEIGRRLGYPASVVRLVREAIGTYTLAEAVHVASEERASDTMAL